MSTAASVLDFAPAPIPFREAMPWVLFGILLLFALSFVAIDESAASMISGLGVHEFLHDSRHLLGFPCH